LARHNPRCALCGAPTRPQKVAGVDSLVCVACGAATVDQSALEQLVGAAGSTPPPPPGQRVATGVASPGPVSATPVPPAIHDSRDEPVFDPDGLAAMSDLEFEQQLQTLRSRRRRQVLFVVGLGLMLFLFVITVPLGLLGLGAIGWSVQAQPSAEDQPMPAPPPELPSPAPAEPAPPPAPAPSEGGADADADPGDDVDAAEAPPTEGDDTAEPAEPAEPAAPEPEPAPAPAPDPVRAHLQQGWAVASRDPARGAESFRKALDLRPGHDEASYGLGYCLLKLDRKPAAAVHLCEARNTPDAEIRRDVQALLANNGLTCSP